MAGIFLLVVVSLSFYGYFSSLKKGDKPDSSDSDTVTSVSILFISPIASLFIAILLLELAPPDMNSTVRGVIAIMLIAGIWYGFTKLIFFLSHKVENR
ncbi:MAG: drug/metabolite transporter (DMT)-like permease [Oleiphilaceae bacterium]|jgi:drug/metabolite transporter (DMT)-like permease